MGLEHFWMVNSQKNKIFRYNSVILLAGRGMTQPMVRIPMRQKRLDGRSRDEEKTEQQ